MESGERAMTIYDFAQPAADGKSAAAASTISYVTVIDDHGDFYLCSLSTLGVQFTDALRKVYRDICSSLVFDEN